MNGWTDACESALITSILISMCTSWQSITTPPFSFVTAGHVHHGLCTYYADLVELGMADRLVSLTQTYPGYTLLVTGHSLGGAAVRFASPLRSALLRPRFPTHPSAPHTINQQPTHIYPFHSIPFHSFSDRPPSAPPTCATAFTSPARSTASASRAWATTSSRAS